MKATRKRIRVLILAAGVAAAAVPVGFALSLESDASHAILPPSGPVAMTVVEPFSSARLFVELPDVPDSAKLFGLGTLLFGVAAAVKRAS